jgi:hypothetical protein
MAKAAASKKVYYHKLPVQLIKAIEKTNTGKLKKTTKAVSIRSTMKASGKQFELKMRSDYFSSKPKEYKFGTEYRKVTFSSKSQTLVLEKLFFSNHSSNILTGNIHSFYTKGYSKIKKYRYRLIIPLKHEMNFHYQIDETLYVSDFGYSTWNGLTCIINGETMHAHIIHDKEKKKNYYLSIHSDKPQTYYNFSEKAFAVKNGIGYLTGYMAGDKGYFFTYTTAKMEVPKHLYFSSFRDTIRSHYRPVHSNPYSWLSSIPRKTAERLYKSNKIQPVSKTAFSTLCQKLYDSVEFTSVIMLILESSIASLLFMPGGYAIALESLSKMVMEGVKSKKIAPVPSKEMRDILKRFRAIIDSELAHISSENRALLKHRVEQLNQPTNKAKLQLPFELLNIPLNIQDLQILDSRNDFLHGRTPDITKAGSKRTVDRMNKDMYYSALRFSTLLAKLILKWSGFDGYIVNQVRIHGKRLGIKCNEPYYIKL